MMRSGRLLAEESPEHLLRIYNLSSLENVFLKLCMKDEGTDQEASAPLERSASSRIVRRNPARDQQQPAVGHDNMAFERTTSQSDVSEMSIGRSAILPADCNAVWIFIFTRQLPFFIFTGVALSWQDIS